MLPYPALEVDVFIVDAPRVAPVALGAARADAECTYVLCRHLDETSADFWRRIQRRIERIARTCCIRSLCYVIGPEAARGQSAVPLLGELMPSLAAGASLTVAGPGSHRGVVFGWLDALLQRRAKHVSVRARLYDDGHEGSVFIRPSRAESEHAVPLPAALPPAGRAGGWFRKELAGSSHPGVGLPQAS